MGYVCRKENVLHCLGALEAVLRQCGLRAPPGAGVDAALAIYRAAISAPGAPPASAPAAGRKPA